jgi:type IV secretory pathway ATPase VirB11/archaellum biosynthesis ATPase
MQLPNGDRLNAVLYPPASRPRVTIRRHNFDLHRLAHLVEAGAIDRTLESFLTAATLARLNIVIAGGTNSGKTTMLRCLVNAIPPSERLITIEDSLEIGLERFADLHPDYETLTARTANTEGVGQITLAQLVRTGLRMSPDRVIVGEVRGDEILPMLLAMSQGNDGSLCTIHASTSKETFKRFQMYAAMTPERLDAETTNLLVANAVHLVVHIGWVDGRRVVTSVREVVDVDGPQLVSNEIFQPGPDGRAVPGFPIRDDTMHRLQRTGSSRSCSPTVTGGGPHDHPDRPACRRPGRDRAVARPRRDGRLAAPPDPRAARRQGRLQQTLARFGLAALIAVVVLVVTRWPVAAALAGSGRCWRRGCSAGPGHGKPRSTRPKRSPPGPSRSATRWPPQPGSRKR